MIGVIIACLLMSAVLASSNEGNIHLLEEEVSAAIRSCTESNPRQRRSDPNRSPRIDSNTQEERNQYGHVRRASNDTGDQIYVLNATDYDYDGYGAGNAGEKLVTEVPRTVNNRTRRHEPLFDKEDSDQCLSQCVFANLQVVDARGIPREAELWSRIQSSITSQQSRAALRNQLRACFQELQSEAEDDGCSYSNKLERCLMLQLAERKTNTTETKTI